MVLKNKTKSNRKLLFLFTLILSILLSLFLVGKNTNKVFQDYALVETKKFLSSIINNVLKEEPLTNFEKQYGSIFIERKNKEDLISAIDIDNKVLNEFLNYTISSIENQLIKIENGNINGLELPKTITKSKYNKLKKGIIIEIPSGIIFNNIILYNISPKIPVKVHLLGNAIGKIKFKAKDYGINNTLMEVYIEVVLEEEILLPTTVKREQISYNILVDTKLIQGPLPEYYLSNGLYTKE